MWYLKIEAYLPSQVTELCNILIGSLHSGLKFCIYTPLVQSATTLGSRKFSELKAKGTFLNQNSPSSAMPVASTINSLVNSILRVLNETLSFSNPWANPYETSVWWPSISQNIETSELLEIILHIQGRLQPMSCLKA